MAVLALHYLRGRQIDAAKLQSHGISNSVTEAEDKYNFIRLRNSKGM